MNQKDSERNTKKVFGGSRTEQWSSGESPLYQSLFPSNVSKFLFGFLHDFLFISSLRLDLVISPPSSISLFHYLHSLVLFLVLSLALSAIHSLFRFTSSLLHFALLVYPIFPLTHYFFSSHSNSRNTLDHSFDLSFSKV